MQINEWLSGFLLVLGGAAIATVAAVIFTHRRGEGDTGVRRDVNVHAWYSTGILGFLLVCVLAVDWGSIPELVTVLSFAVGLASLILALIAIIQTLTSTGKVDGALVAVREAAERSSRTGSELAATVAAIQKAAGDAQAASTSAVAATGQFSSIAAAIIESSEAGRHAITQLREEVLAKGAAPTSADKASAAAGPVTITGATMGGVAALYAALRSIKENKPFVLSDVFVDDPNLSFENGYLSALENAGALTGDVGEGIVTVRSAHFDQSIDDMIEELKSYKFASKDTQATHEARMAQVDAFFKQA